MLKNCQKKKKNCGFSHFFKVYWPYICKFENRIRLQESALKYRVDLQILDLKRNIFTPKYHGVF